MTLSSRPSSILYSAPSPSRSVLRFPLLQKQKLLRTTARPRCAPLRVLATAGVDWSSVKSEAQFKGVLRAAQEKGAITEPLRCLWEDFYDNYKTAVLGSKVEGNDEGFVARIQATIADRVFHQFAEPYTFPSHHKRVLEPFNYYKFGQEYVGSLVDFQNSFIGHLEIWQQIADQLDQGDNVVLLANHQTEADAGVFAHMIKTSFPKMAEDVTYVAGDRVITDPLCKPFSMGRNLFCVYSKRHIDDVPEQKAEKMANNNRTVRVMAKKLNEGGQLLWIAPSGGRDRPNKDGLWVPNEFDDSSVGLMQRLLEKSKKEGHLYAMAMVCWKIMPPPVQIQDIIGERRVTNFNGVGISVTPEIDVDAVVAHLGEDATREMEQVVLAAHAQDICVEEYLKLAEVIDNPDIRSQHPEFQQPWLKQSIGAGV